MKPFSTLAGAAGLALALLGPAQAADFGHGRPLIHEDWSRGGHYHDHHGHHHHRHWRHGHRHHHHGWHHHRHHGHHGHHRGHYHW